MTSHSKSPLIGPDPHAPHDPHDLHRFLAAQEKVYDRARGELLAGRKQSHWMWFIFPQVEGLGLSAMARRYAIADLDEARAYLAHPVLGARLRECAGILLGVEESSAAQIFGSPDDMTSSTPGPPLLGPFQNRHRPLIPSTAVVLRQHLAERGLRSVHPRKQRHGRALF